ncbi:type I-B CRISPR-associated endonuclease Cas1 [Candidatus Dojkabacteria bacterium]|nr:type I-B CRISPR-associated endonuclease Cas1 [Candidatus Dojkabacteria bacterium]
MNSNLYITKSGKLSRKDNTLLFKNKEIKKVIPVENIKTIYLLGETSLNTKLLNFLSQKQIILHIFNYYGFYTGSFIPKEGYVSGKLLVKQVEFYTNLKKRITLASKFVEGIANNLLYVLRHYSKHGANLKDIRNRINSKTIKIKNVKDIKEMLSVEGGIWDNFYSSFERLLPQNFQMETRKIRPPNNPMNALISFANSLLYTQTLSQIYHTQLNPTIAYLHEPSEKRFSLCLDISEVFKPDMTFRLIFKLINKNMIKISDFDEKKNFCLLNEKGRVKFLQEFDNRLNQTKKHPKLKRNISNKRLIRIECYKLIKHFMGEKQYKPYSLENKF